MYRALLQEAKALNDPDVADAERIQLLSSLVCSSDKPEFLETAEAGRDAEQLYFHSDRIYDHNILHINFTSYDVRRETDIVNPKTSRRDVMCLRRLDDEEQPEDSEATPQPLPQQHQFLHARVLRIFHTNVIYRGRGSSDLRRRRFDFLLVRWFEFAESSPALNRLDRLILSPVGGEHSIGFLDPADVLRASHVVPRYSLGRRYPESDGSDRMYPNPHTTDRIVSKLARDWEDWSEYYANR